MKIKSIFLSSTQHEDFDKAIGNQEEKIESLSTYADQLMAGPHYAVDDIDSKKKDVLSRWQELKEALVRHRPSNLDIANLVETLKNLTLQPPRNWLFGSGRDVSGFCFLYYGPLSCP